jgi:RNA polymerase sigma factor (sigma-70 family)
MTSRDFYHRLMERYPVWTKDQERVAGARLVAARADRDAAATRKIEHEFVYRNLRLVFVLLGTSDTASVALDDLVQHALVALMHAAEKFDPARDLRFSTYAAWWLRQSRSRAIYNEGSTIRRPVHLLDLERRVRRARARFETACGREPTDAELAEQLGMPVEKLTERISRIGVHVQPMSLDAPAHGDFESPLVEAMASPTGNGGPEAVEEKEREDEVGALMRCILPSERDVVQRRFYGEETFEALAESRGVSRARAQQLEAKALDKMRAVGERRRSMRRPSGTFRRVVA